MPVVQHSLDPSPRTTPNAPAERDSAVLRSVTGARLRARMREMREAVTRMSRDQQQQAVMTDAAIPRDGRMLRAGAAPPTVPLGTGNSPTPRAVPRFTVGEAISHPRSNQIARIAGSPRPWSTGLLWPVCWLRRDGRGGLCWTPWYTWVWQEELVSIQ